MDHHKVSTCACHLSGMLTSLYWLRECNVAARMFFELSFHHRYLAPTSYVSAYGERVANVLPYRCALAA